jgi:hypothetical protein
MPAFCKALTFKYIINQRIMSYFWDKKTASRAGIALVLLYLCCPDKKLRDYYHV